jgi:hypothetical protein
MDSIPLALFAAAVRCCVVHLLSVLEEVEGDHLRAKLVSIVLTVCTNVECVFWCAVWLEHSIVPVWSCRLVQSLRSFGCGTVR